VCLYPNIIKNRKYVINEKNGGIIPPCNNERVKWVSVGCQKCIECRKQKAQGWQVRLHEDLKHNKNGKFVTLTFSDEELNKIEKTIGEEVDGYSRDNEVCRYAIRHFTENWRKKFGKTLRHWLVTELGQTKTERVHIHGIVWTDEVEEIKKKWKYGHVWIGEYVNSKTVNYIVKYVNKVDKIHKEYQSKIYASKGIGKEYIERKDAKRHKYKEGKTIETYKTKEGVILGLPVYYRNKLYTEEEREKLWIEKLDKGERWVCGVKIDVNASDEEYYEVLKEKRMYNKRMGYGDDASNWEQKRYERQRRNLIKQERIKKAQR